MTRRVTGGSLTITLRRRIVGLAAVFCGIGAVVAWKWGETGNLWHAGLLRAGILLAVLWVALPDRDRPAAWQQLRPFPALLWLGAFLTALRAPKVGLPMLFGLVAWQVLFGGRTRGRTLNGASRETSPRR